MKLPKVNSVIILLVLSVSLIIVIGSTKISDRWEKVIYHGLTSVISMLGHQNKAFSQFSLPIKSKKNQEKESWYTEKSNLQDDQSKQQHVW